jgi:hypothetical protein
LLEWLQSFGKIERIGVEGPGCYGAGLTRFLRRHHQRVIEVNRPDRRSRRIRGKSDPLDAESAARRALAGEDQVIPKDTTTIVEAIRALRIARTGAVKSRTAAYNQLRDLILTAPDSLRETLRGKTLHRVALEGARLRPDMGRLTDPTQATKLALRTIGRRVAALNIEIADLDHQLGQLVKRAAPRTLELIGVGTENAAQLLITAGGNPERLRSEASFAALCAASPIPASSGKTNRYRLTKPRRRSRREPRALPHHPGQDPLLPTNPRLPAAAPDRGPLQTRSHPLRQAIHRAPDLPRHPSRPRGSVRVTV